MKTEQWAPNGILSGVPGRISALLAEDGKTLGYAPSNGWSFTFYHPAGDVVVLPGQWVTRHDNGAITVTDLEPIPERERQGDTHP